MTCDPTETIRRALVSEINAEPGSRESLEAKYGKVWDTQELQEEFEVLGFMAPFCVVRKKKTMKLGSVSFQHSPRFYFDFVED
jgi:hypothetical protein